MISVIDTHPSHLKTFEAQGTRRGRRWKLHLTVVFWGKEFGET